MRKNLCKCGCGNFAKLGNQYINGHNRGMEGKHHTKQTKKKMGRAMSGKNNPMYGRTGENNPSYGKPRLCMMGKNNPMKRPEVRAKNSESRRGKPHHSEETKRRMRGENNPMRRPEVRAKFIGKNHPRWISGLKRKYPIEFNNQLKQSIRERDNYICQLCGRTQEENGRKLDVHHIDYNKINIHPLNLITLCRSCNLVVEYDIDGWMLFFRRKISAKKRKVS